MTSWADERREKCVKAIANIQYISENAEWIMRSIREHLEWWNSLSPEKIKELEKAVKAGEKR